MTATYVVEHDHPTEGFVLELFPSLREAAQYVMAHWPDVEDDRMRDDGSIVRMYRSET